MARIILDGFEDSMNPLWDYTNYYERVTTPLITGSYSGKKYQLYKTLTSTSTYDLYFSFRFDRSDGYTRSMLITIDSKDANSNLGQIFGGIWDYPYTLCRSGLLIQSSGSNFSIVDNTYNTILWNTSEMFFDVNHVQIRIKSNQDNSWLLQVKLNGQLVGNETIAANSYFAASGQYMKNVAMYVKTVSGDSSQLVVDDIVIDDSEWPGNSRIYNLAPSNDGYYSEWVRKIIADPYNEVYADWQCVRGGYILAYITTNTALDKSTFGLTKLPDETVSVKNVVYFANALTPGYPILDHLQLMHRIDGVNFYGSSRELDYAYGLYGSSIMSLNPKTSTNWTKGDIDDLEIGVRSTSS